MDLTYHLKTESNKSVIINHSNDTCMEQPLQADCPAVWEGSYPIFYVMHITGILQIGLSIVGSAIVIFAIMRRLGRGKSVVGFSDRFPLYVAITDLLWGLSHITDHIMVLSTHFYPSKWAVLIQSNANFFCLCYQQLMYTGIALYTYLKIVKGVSLTLGRWDWKLHAVCFAMVVPSTAVMDAFGLLGVARFWILQAEGSPHYRIPFYFSGAFTVVQAVCTLMTYSLIKRTVASHRAALNLTSNDRRNTVISSSFHDTAEQCLTTFVLVGIFLYTPYAGVSVALFILDTFIGNDLLVISWYSTTLWFLLLVFCNAGGWVNALAYFRNERIKRNARQKNKGHNQRKVEGGTMKTDTTTSHGQTVTTQIMDSSAY